MEKSILYYGDNLKVLRENVKDESVDLIYLDPPFNSQANYNVLFRAPTGEQSHAQIEAFEDTWHWGDSAEHAFDEVMKSGNTDAAELLRAMRSFLKENDMMAYLTMLAVRLLELHRVLKETGSLYLHCDPTASHYLKLLLDAVFEPACFRNEIIWQRTPPRGQAFTRFPSTHDVILFYGRSDAVTWNTQYLPHREEYISSHYSQVDPETGRHYQLTSLLNPNPNRPNLTYEFMGTTRVWRWTQERMLEEQRNGRIVVPEGGVPRYKRYLDEMSGTAVTSVWTDIPPINSQAQERLGYPTQKPLPLMERIIASSSNEGDIVLDPFCGCGTTIHAAQKLNRRWIGIDVTHLAISLIEKRLNDAFPGIEYEVHGTPKDLEGARDLALRDKYQFQWWAVSLVNAVPFGGKKKGADSGIDGIIYFKNFKDGKPVTERIIVSVKGGENVNVAMVRDLAHVVDREQAKMGLFITLAPPTEPMSKEAVTAGFYEAPNGKDQYRKIQIVTIGDLLDGKKPDLPPQDPSAFLQAPREDDAEQLALIEGGGASKPSRRKRG
jgi:site-specific DNA-methyltransferase (adenine-specific)